MTQDNIGVGGQPVLLGTLSQLTDAEKKGVCLGGWHEYEQELQERMLIGPDA